MQAAGGLKKKRKRNLAKVGGLSTFGYKLDYFDIHQMYSDTPNHRTICDLNLNQTYPNNGHIAIKISRLSTSNKDRVKMPMSDHCRRPNSRVTRDPRFFDTFDEGAVPTRPIDLWTHPDTPKSTPASASSKQARHNRPVLLSPTLLSRLNHILTLGLLSWSFPWRWNKETCQIDRWSKKMETLWTWIWTLLSLQSAAITLFQFYSFFARMSLDEEGSYRPVFMNSFCVLWYTYAVSLDICMYFYREKIRRSINCMLRLNMEYVEKYLVDIEGYKEGGGILTNISIRTNTCQVFISTCLFLMMPYQPWYLYSYVYTEDNPWYWVIPGAVQEFVVVGQILAVYLLIGWVVVAHANSVEFWLQEAHNHNDTGYTSEELRQPHKALETYRSLQVLTCIFNSAMAPWAIPLNKMISWSALIPCGFVLIRSMNQKFIKEFPGILTYPFGVIDCVTCAFGLLQISARMCDIANSFLNSWSQTKHKDLRRVLVSCPVLKVKVSSFYNVSVSTTITYFKSCFDYIVDCIITFK